MNKQWFVLNTLTGQENKALESIKARIQLERMEEYIGRCEIPTEKVTEKKKDGKKRTYERKFFPGYLLCELALFDEAAGLDEFGKKIVYDRTWQFIRETPGLIGVLGGKSAVPLKQSEVDAIFLNKPSSAQQAARPKVSYEIGETVKVVDGAFMGLTGQVSMVDPDKGKLKVEVNIFNRTVQVDAEYWQVEKAPEGAADAKKPAQ